MKNKKSSKITGMILLLSASLIFCSCSLFRPVTPNVDHFPSDTESVSTSPTVDTATPDSTDTSEHHSDTTDENLPVHQATETPDTEPPVIEKEAVVSFVGAGDNIVYYGNVRDAASCAVQDGRKYNFAPVYTDVADMIAGADISFINQETLMCGDGYDFSYYPQFNGPQDLAYDLIDVGFDVINIANNHMLDKGAAGLLATVDFWRSLDNVTLLGGYKTNEEYNDIQVLDVNGIRIAFLTYTEFTNLGLQGSKDVIIPYKVNSTVIAQLKAAKLISDYVVVSVHWGDENTFTPNTAQREFASLLAANGADVILGHHPHVIQPIEWIDQPDGGRTLCVYSLGNFMAEQAMPYNMLGGLISFDIVMKGDSVTTENVVFTPTVYYFNTRFYSNCVYKITNFTDSLASSHGLAYYGQSITVNQVYQYLRSTIAAEFLPDEIHT